MNVFAITIRNLADGYPQMMARAFEAIGWKSKPPELFERYLREQNAGTRLGLVAFASGEFAGYITINWKPTYPPLSAKWGAELQDLNVLPEFRRRGVASQLIDEAEDIVAEKCDVVGIAVGLHPGYSTAQRLYVLRGYVPDGNGVTVDDEFVSEGQSVVIDDRLVLHMEKQLS